MGETYDFGKYINRNTVVMKCEQFEVTSINREECAVERINTYKANVKRYEYNAASLYQAGLMDFVLKTVNHRLGGVSDDAILCKDIFVSGDYLAVIKAKMAKSSDKITVLYRVLFSLEINGLRVPYADLCAMFNEFGVGDITPPEQREEL